MNHQVENFRALIKQSRLCPILTIEAHYPKRTREWVLNIGAVLLLLGLVLILVSPAFAVYLGWWLILLFLIASLAMLEFYFRSYYYGNIIDNAYRTEDIFTFTVGRVVYDAGESDILPAFCRSKTGRLFFRRLGIPETEVQNFLAGFRGRPAIALSILPGEIFKLRQLMLWFWQAYGGFRDWLQYFDVGQEDLLEVASWLVRDIEREAKRDRWWSSARLAQVPSLTADWGYGEMNLLAKHGRDLTEEVADDSASERVILPEAEQLELVFLRSRQRNALVIAGGHEAGEAVLLSLARRLKRSGSGSPLSGHHLFLLNTSLLAANFPDRADLERELLKLFHEVVSAGNVILGFDDLPALLAELERRGIQVADFLQPYLSSSGLPIVALADQATFNRVLEPRSGLLEYFERIIVDEPNSSFLIKGLQDLAESLEKRQDIFFTHQAIAEICRGVEQYFQSESLADKTADLLTELVPWSLGRGRRVVTKALALEFLKEITHIPMGEIEEGEREQLLSLEKLLHRRVVGQEEAIGAIAKAVRRGRAGVRNPARPMGSFLFLGPTGVGKTEVAKALAAVFFGREASLLRLDMSEYQSSDALPRLIGSFESGQPGALSTLARQHSYGVLLLDEFEKANPDVRNLFLQILDEGFFSDMSGRRVNVRNLIFIATSNAGADLVWDLAGRNQIGPEAQKLLIEHLIREGIYKPELLNRFDEVVLFHPLSRVQLAEVARILLARLASRLAERGITLEISDELVDRVVEDGSNRQFGARPMQRYIQDQIEERVARALISGEAGSGRHIRFNDRLELSVS